MIYMIVYSIAVITLSIGVTCLSRRQPACAVVRQAGVGKTSCPVAHVCVSDCVTFELGDH